MNEKIYKNKNMIRSEHPVKRTIIFNNMIERSRFLNLYKDLLKSYNEVENSRFGDVVLVSVVYKKECFDKIVNDLGLVDVSKKYPRSHGMKYYKTKEVLA